MNATMHSKKLPGFENIRPPAPTIRDERVALAIARRIVAEVNLDDFYWATEEIPDRVFDVQQELIRGIVPADIFAALELKQPFISCERRERVLHPYGYEGIDEHCRHIANEIADQELETAVDAWRERYE